MEIIIGRTQFPVLHSKLPCQEGINDTIEEVFKWTEDFIAPTGFIAGTKSMTVADISVLATYSTLLHTGLISQDQFQGTVIYEPVKITFFNLILGMKAWFERCQ